MNRILVLGCCGAGKSTLARKLHAKLNVELIHLDQHYWLPNWTEIDPAEWREKVKGLVEKEQWIMDGNFSNTLDIRLERADTILYLDYPTIKCVYRVLKRVLKNWGTVRPDMPEGCKDKLDFEFLHYTATYNNTKRKKMLEKLKNLENNKHVFIFKTDREAARFVEGIA